MPNCAKWFKLITTKKYYKQDIISLLTPTTIFKTNASFHMAEAAFPGMNFTETLLTQ